MPGPYEDHAEVYDHLVTELRDRHTAEVVVMVLGLLARTEPGLCIDVGCGTGVVASVLEGVGWRVVGVDLAHRQLVLATKRDRLTRGVVADAARLPLGSGTADLVVSTYTHTDVADWPEAVGEMARVLRPGGLWVYVGAHPCFVGPHAQRGPRNTMLHDGYYRDSSLRHAGPGLTPGGLRERTGVRHLSLVHLLGPVFGALVVERLAEGDGPPPVPLPRGSDDIPWLLGVRAVRP